MRDNSPNATLVGLHRLPLAFVTDPAPVSFIVVRSRVKELAAALATGVVTVLAATQTNIAGGRRIGLDASLGVARRALPRDPFRRDVFHAHAGSVRQVGRR